MLHHCLGGRKERLSCPGSSASGKRHDIVSIASSSFIRFPFWRSLGRRPAQNTVRSNFNVVYIHRNTPSWRNAFTYSCCYILYALSLLYMAIHLGPIFRLWHGILKRSGSFRCIRRLLEGRLPPQTKEAASKRELANLRTAHHLRRLVECFLSFLHEGLVFRCRA